MPAPTPQRLLVVRLGAIGDVINALLFATAIKERYPAAHLAWAVHPLALPLVEGHPDVDRVHLWTRGSGIGGFARLVRDLRKERYDVAVDLQRITKSALLARLSGAQRVLGYDPARTKEASWLWTTETIAPAGEGVQHMALNYLAFARHLGADALPRHRFPADPAAAAWAEELRERMGGAPLLLNIGASKPANRWSPQRFGELAQRLTDSGLGPIALTGGPGDIAAGAEALAAAPARAHNLVGQTDLRQFSALAGLAKLFIGCDTGPMHIAAARGAPVLALFGPADPRRTGPFGPGHRVTSVPPPCAPCGRKHCNQARHACMEDLSVELVHDAALQMGCRPVDPDLSGH